MGERERVSSEVEANVRERWFLKEAWLPVSSFVSGFRFPISGFWFKLAQLGMSPSTFSVPASPRIPPGSHSILFLPHSHPPHLIQREKAQ